MRHNRKTRKVRVSTRDYSRNLSCPHDGGAVPAALTVHGNDQAAQHSLFLPLIQEKDFKGHSPKLSHALHASVNMIYSNLKQITRHQRARGMDAEVVLKTAFSNR